MALIKCPECGKEVSENAESCPSCGNPMPKSNGGAQRPKKKKNVGCFGTIIIFLIFISVAVALGGKSKEPQSTKKAQGTETNISETEEKKEDLEILSYENLDEGVLRYVTGQVKNNTDKNYSYVQIEIKMYKDDTVLGTALDNMNNLGAGETWQFKALISDEECNRYTIEKVSGF